MYSRKELKQRVNELKLEIEEQPMLFAQLADLHLQLGQSKQAAELLDDGVQQFPQYETGWVVQGKLYLQQSKSDEALSAFEQALNINSDNSYVHEKCCELTLDKNRDAYIYHLRELKRLDPLDDNVLKMLEVALLRQAALDNNLYEEEQVSRIMPSLLKKQLIEENLLPDELQEIHEDLTDDGLAESVNKPEVNLPTGSSDGLDISDAAIPSNTLSDEDEIEEDYEDDEYETVYEDEIESDELNLKGSDEEWIEVDENGNEYYVKPLKTGLGQDKALVHPLLDDDYIDEETDKHERDKPELIPQSFPPLLPDKPGQERQRERISQADRFEDSDIADYGVTNEPRSRNKLEDDSIRVTAESDTDQNLFFGQYSEEELLAEDEETVGDHFDSDKFQDDVEDAENDYELQQPDSTTQVHDLEPIEDDRDVKFAKLEPDLDTTEQREYISTSTEPDNTVHAVQPEAEDELIDVFESLSKKAIGRRHEAPPEKEAVKDDLVVTDSVDAITFDWEKIIPMPSKLKSKPPSDDTEDPEKEPNVEQAESLWEKVDLIDAGHRKRENQIEEEIANDTVELDNISVLKNKYSEQDIDQFFDLLKQNSESQKDQKIWSEYDRLSHAEPPTEKGSVSEEIFSIESASGEDAEVESADIADLDALLKDKPETAESKPDGSIWDDLIDFDGDKDKPDVNQDAINWNDAADTVDTSDTPDNEPISDETNELSPWDADTESSEDIPEELITIPTVESNSATEDGEVLFELVEQIIDLDDKSDEVSAAQGEEETTFETVESEIVKDSINEEELQADENITESITDDVASPPEDDDDLSSPYFTPSPSDETEETALGRIDSDEELSERETKGDQPFIQSTYEPTVSKTMAELYASQGEWSRAIETYEKLMQKQPENEMYEQRIEALKKKMGKPN